MPCLRHRSAHFAPASCSARMPMICSSVKRVRFIVRPQVGSDSNRGWRKNLVAGHRGGLTSKIHAVVDAFGLPIGLSLSEGQAYNGHQAAPLQSNLPENAIVLADRAYDADIIRDLITSQQAFPNILQRRRCPPFSKYLYKMRNLVERFFNKIKHFRAIATRYENDPRDYMAGVKLASARIWIKFNESAT
ncbi:IS5 family transposase (plasmid) [Roseibium aggregatum]|nr:IS5 family transposase [Roseibium aggregatum]